MASERIKEMCAVAGWQWAKMSQEEEQAGAQVLRWNTPSGWQGAPTGDSGGR